MSASAKRIRQLLSWLGDRDRQLQLALDAAELGTWNWDPATNELVWSERCRTLLGVSADEPATVDNFLRLVHADDRAAVGQAIETALQDRNSYSIEYRIVRPDGETRWLHSLGRVHQTDPQGRSVGMSGIVRDVTAAHRAAEAALRQKQYLAQLLEAAPAGVAKLDRDLRILAANALFRESLRLGTTDLVGQSLHELLPGLPAAWRERFEQGLGGVPLRFAEECLPRADGSSDWIKGQVVPWYDDHAAIGGIVLMFEVLTQQRHAQAQLRRQDEQQRLDQRYRLLVDRLPLGIMLSDRDGIVTYLNPAWQALASPDHEQALGLHQAEVVHPQDRARIRAGWQRLAQEPYADLEFRLRPQGTVERWVHGVSTALRDVNGDILGYAHACIDVSRRRLERDATGQRHDQVLGLAHRLLRLRQAERLDLAGLLQRDILGELTALPAGESSLAVTIERLRRIVYELNPPGIEELGFAGALEHFLVDQAEQAGFEFELAVPETPMLAPPKALAVIYSVAQEAIVNVARHARATRVHLVVSVGDGKLQLQVRDNGVGISAGAWPRPQCYGLLAASERLAELGGTLHAAGAPGQGTIVEATIPLTMPQPSLHIGESLT